MERLKDWANLMKKININPNKKLFYWGPSDGRPAFPDFWNLGMFLFSRDYKPGWPENVLYFEKEKLTFFCEEEKLYENGEKIFRKFVLDDKEFHKNYRKWENALKNFKKESAKILRPDLSHLNNKKFEELFLEFSAVYQKDFWYHGLLPKISGWGGERLLGKELEKVIKNKHDIVHALEKLAAPEEYSFFQKEELDLLSLRLGKNNKEREDKLKEHQKKYFWMLNNYHSAKIVPVSYFKNILTKISKEEAEIRLNQIRKNKSKARELKKEIVKKYKLPNNILKISKRLAFCIWWQDLRKSYIFQANQLISLFIKEFSRRSKIGEKNLHFYTVEDFVNLLYGKKVGKTELIARKNNFLIHWELKKGNISLVSGKEAEDVFWRYAKKETGHAKKELQGKVISSGKVVGTVKIVLGMNYVGKVRKGDILVATMTTPDYVMALKKASAVITDEGGLTSHAAIVARELKIPGIVGTNIATQILKDGDLVEVDADKGVVRILKRKQAKT